MSPGEAHQQTHEQIQLTQQSPPESAVAVMREAATNGPLTSPFAAESLRLLDEETIEEE